jgi:hypothetical protein
MNSTQTRQRPAQQPAPVDRLTPTVEADLTGDRGPVVMHMNWMTPEALDEAAAAGRVVFAHCGALRQPLRPPFDFPHVTCERCEQHRSKIFRGAW